MSVRDFIQRNYRHFNAGTLSDCIESIRQFLDSNGRLMITLAGAMSTAEIGKTLAPAIRSQKVHAICCTGANLEEDLFGLVARSDYERIPNWRELTPSDDLNLHERGLNRVTDVAIPEQEAIRYIEKQIMELWKDAEAAGDRRYPHEYIYDLLLH